MINIMPKLRTSKKWTWQNNEGEIIPNSPESVNITIDENFSVSATV
jgi:hypothetical protein